MLDRRLEVPFPSWLIFEAVEQDHVVAPGQLCSSCCTTRLLGPGLGERPHVFETARAEALDPGKLCLQILGQAIDDLSPPPFRLLPGEDIPATDQYKRISSRLTAKAARI